MELEFPARICPNPVFIIGSPRSGTSILAWSLAHHNQLWTSRESHILLELFDKGHLEEAFERSKSQPGGSWLQEEGVEKVEFLYYLGLGLNALYTSRSQGRRWIEQTPSYTLMADMLADMFPGALFIHMLRDGRRVVHSMINFANRYTDHTRSGWLPQWATGDFRETCRTWRLFVERSMDFCTRHPERCITVVNEELMLNPHKGFRGIFEFLQIPYNTKPAQFFYSARINSSHQSNMPFPSLRNQNLVNNRAFIMASPNPVPPGAGSGTTTISWSTGEYSWGQVYLVRPDGSEQLFTEGRENAADANWINPNTTYEFRLYAEKDHVKLLDRTLVRQSDKTTSSNLDSKPNDSQPTLSRRPSEPWKEWTIEQRMIFYEEAGNILMKTGLIAEDELMRFLK